MPFHFSIRNTIKKSWTLFVSHRSIYLAIALVMILINMSSRTHQFVAFVSIATTILSIVVSYIALSVTLAVIDGKEDHVLHVRSILDHMPTLKQFFQLLGVSILASIPLLIIFGIFFVIAVTFFLGLALGGNIIPLLIIAFCFFIPAVYFTLRLMFGNLAFVDKRGSVGAAIRHSWNITKGSKFWTVFLTVLVVAILVILVSISTFGIGLIIAYPMALLVIAQLYRTLEAPTTEPGVITPITENVVPVLSSEE